MSVCAYSRTRRLGAFGGSWHWYRGAMSSPHVMGSWPAYARQDRGRAGQQHMRQRLVGTVGLAMTLASCEPKPSALARLQGDLYLRTVSGDVTRGAAARVALVPAGASYQAWWKAACDSSDVESRRKEATDSVSRTRMGLEEQMAFLQSRITQLPLEFRDELQQRIDSLGSLATKAARADVTGHYRIDSIPPGDYWVSAGLTLGQLVYQWWIPITVHPADSTRLDLDNSNALGRPIQCPQVPPTFPRSTPGDSGDRP